MRSLRSFHFKYEPKQGKRAAWRNEYRSSINLTCRGQIVLCEDLRFGSQKSDSLHSMNLTRGRKP